jgi:hypothetical protein
MEISKADLWNFRLVLNLAILNVGHLDRRLNKDS